MLTGSTGRGAADLTGDGAVGLNQIASARAVPSPAENGNWPLSSCSCWGHSRRTYLMATFREDEALVIEDIVTGMRRVIDQLPAAERKLILTSMRRKWSDIADRLEAPSSRNH
jgi:hypothetical protein